MLLFTAKGELINTSEQGGQASRRRAEADQSPKKEGSAGSGVEGQRLHIDGGEGHGQSEPHRLRTDRDGDYAGDGRDQRPP